MTEYIVRETGFPGTLKKEVVGEIVRCKDCKWWDRKNKGNSGYCHAAKHSHWSANWEISIYRTHKEDFFCADGEREENGE